MTTFNMGIDIGSTTAKVAVLDQNRQVLFSAYRRHNAETLVTLQTILQILLSGVATYRRGCDV